jgi:RND family efflux transporter MFP subunit
MNKQSIIVSFIIAIICYACSGGVKEQPKKETAAAAPQYQTAIADKSGVDQVVKLPAQLAAFEEVSIFPKMNGYVKTVRVDIGSTVKKGQLLMELEAPELDQASTQAKEKYARSIADYTISKENYERLRQASNTKGAVSPMDLASAKAKVTADSTVCNAEKASWQMQQTILSYLQVTAPFDGMITERNVHPGALVSAEGKSNKPMLELRQMRHLRLQVDIPERLAANLGNAAEVSFYLSAFPGKKMTGHISRRSKTVNLQYRSERVELDINNDNGLLSPGMYADVLLSAKASPGAVTVPRSAVVTSTQRKYVLCVRNGKTVKVDVTTGNETAEKVEVMGDIKAGDEVVINANDEMKEGINIGKN